MINFKLKRLHLVIFIIKKLEGNWRGDIFINY